MKDGNAQAGVAALVFNKKERRESLLIIFLPKLTNIEAVGCKEFTNGSKVG
jgi:hypothetical protein